MARALLVGCGCCGAMAGAELLERGWAVRGTSRDPDRRRRMGELGIEPADADPDLVGSIVELLGDVTVVAWLLGSASGPEQAAALHRERLPSLLEKLVDTPVRGFLYEAAGSVGSADLAFGLASVEDAGRRWMIPAATLTEARSEPPSWASAVADEVEGLLA